MSIPDFVAIAKVYAPTIDFNKYPLDPVVVGRFISFDMRAEDGCEYIARICKEFSELELALLRGKEHYDADIHSGKAVSNPSRAALMDLISIYGVSDVVRQQLSAVDNYELLRYISGDGPWPNDHWDVVCPELADLAKHLRELREAPVELSGLTRPVDGKTNVEQLADLLSGVNIQELVQSCDVRLLIEFLEGRLSVEQEDKVLHDLWTSVSKELIHCIVMKRWPDEHILADVGRLIPRKYHNRLNGLVSPRSKSYRVLADVYTLIRGNNRPVFDDPNLNIAVDVARAAYHAEPNQGASEMTQAIKINYHARLTATNGVLSGTITLSINGELAIVDVGCHTGEIKVSYNWVTMPKKGYDTTVHSLVRWFDDVPAAAVMVTVYPDGGRPQTVTVTLEA